MFLRVFHESELVDFLLVFISPMVENSDIAGWTEVTEEREILVEDPEILLQDFVGSFSIGVIGSLQLLLEAFYIVGLSDRNSICSSHLDKILMFLIDK